MMQHPENRALYDYWNALRNGRAAPFRSEIDPRRIGAPLANAFVLETAPAGRLRFRVAGSGLAALFGADLHGAESEAMMTEESAGDLRALARRVLDRPAVGVMRAEAVAGPARSPGVELVLLPLRSETGEMNRLLGAVNAAAAPARGDPERLRLACVSVELLAIDVDPRADHALPPGFAEPAAPFLRPAPAQPRLTAIEGARKPAGGPKPAPGRGHLRLVKD